MDGRPREADDPLSGMVGGTAEETAEAATIVDDARRRADELVRRALAEAAEVRRHAEQTGYRDGYQRGASEAQAELADALALLQRAAAEGKSLRDDLLRRAEHEMIELVLEALHAILGARVAEDASVVRATVRRALERAGAQNVVRLRVHPDEADAVSAFLAEDDTAPGAFEVRADGTVGLGGCVVDTVHGRVDARLDVQLEAIARMLRESLPPLPSERVRDA